MTGLYLSIPLSSDSFCWRSWPYGLCGWLLCVVKIDSTLKNRGNKILYKTIRMYYCLTEAFYGLCFFDVL